MQEMWAELRSRMGGAWTAYRWEVRLRRGTCVAASKVAASPHADSRSLRLIARGPRASAALTALLAASMRDWADADVHRGSDLSVSHERTPRPGEAARCAAEGGRAS